MSTTTIHSFTTESNYTFDSNKIEFVAGEAKLKIGETTSETWTEPFDSDTGFTYESNNVLFSSGTATHILPDNQESVASYQTNINLDDGGGVLTGTATGGASVVDGRLDLAHDDLRYVSYSPTNNATMGNVFSVKFKFTPNYSGIPTSNQYMLSAGNVANSFNRIDISHRTDDRLSVILWGNDGALLAGIFFVSDFSPTAGVTYEILCCVNLPESENKIFIDGVLRRTNTETIDRSGAPGALLVVGSSRLGVETSNFYLEDLIFYDVVHQTANYTPGYTVPTSPKIETKVDLPTITYTGIGNIQSYTSLVDSVTGTVGYIINDKYWNGSAWVTSDGSYAQSNSKADFNTNIASLTPINTMDISVVYPGETGGNAAVVSSVQLNYSGEQYYTDNPTVYYNSINYISELLTFTEATTVTGSDAIKYAIEVGGINKYWDGAAWSTSSGYAETNTAAEINTNAESLLSGRESIRVIIYLHSDDGSTTPSIDTLSYSFDDSLEPVTPTLINFAGVIYTNNAALVGDEIKVRPYLSGFANEGIFYEYEYYTIATTDSNGFWNGFVAKNPVGTYWQVKIGKQSYKVDLSSSSEEVIVDIADVNPILIED